MAKLRKASGAPRVVSQAVAVWKGGEMFRMSAWDLNMPWLNRALRTAGSN